MDDDIKKNTNNFKDERRRYPRLKISVDVDYYIYSDSEPVEKKKTKSKDISVGGICLFVYEDIKIGTILNLKFKLPKDYPAIEAKGKVVWRNSFKLSTEDKMNYELGVEFTEISAFDLETISRHISYF